MFLQITIYQISRGGAQKRGTRAKRTLDLSAVNYKGKKLCY
ncbi:hypothetical protein Hanom_Chr07g00637641 [Helianthus anomalus]